MIGLLLLTAASLPATSIADETNQQALLVQAEEQYQAGLRARVDMHQARPHFRESARAYERLWQSGFHNPALARNLAQAYLLAYDLAEAIRAYHLGLRIAPHDKELQAGLALAREQVQYPVTGSLDHSCRPRERQLLLRLASADEFRAIAALIYLVAMLALARAWITRRRLWWVAGGVSLAAAMALASWVRWEEQRMADEQQWPLAIVAENGTPLRRGNGDEYPLRLDDKLPAGVEMKMLDKRGGWLQVQLAGGAIGWVDGMRVIEVK